MKKPTPQYFNSIIEVLTDLKALFPKHTIGKHISTAVDENDMWSISDSSLLYALKKYKAEVEHDGAHCEEQDLEKIISDGMNLDSILDDEEEEY